MCVNIIIGVDYLQSLSIYSHYLHFAPLQAFKLIDDLLGELGSVKEQMDSLNSNVDNVEKKVNNFCAFKDF